MRQRGLFLFYLLVGIVLTGCATPVPEPQWNRFTTNLSGAAVSISTPRGHFRDVSVPSVDLSVNTKPLILLFERSWIASGFLADRGGMELKLLLAKHHAQFSGQAFMEAVRLDYQAEVGRVFPDAELVAPSTRTIGGRQWTCFFVTKIQLPDCVLELPDRSHYLIWRRTWIANSSRHPPSEFVELADKIERSVALAF